jgi:hypothetical protein
MASLTPYAVLKDVLFLLSKRSTTLWGCVVPCGRYSVRPLLQYDVLFRADQAMRQDV